MPHQPDSGYYLPNITHSRGKLPTLAKNTSSFPSSCNTCLHSPEIAASSAASAWIVVTCMFYHAQFDPGAAEKLTLTSGYDFSIVDFRSRKFSGEKSSK